MSISQSIVETLIPDADRNLVEQLSIVWDEVIDLIIDRTMDFSEPHIGDLHISLREEMILELAKLQLFVGNMVVRDRVSARRLEQLSPDEERRCCLSEDGLQRIENTARIIADHIWIRKYRERWKPKTEAALRREENPKVVKLSPKKVEKNHFISRSFIQKYWSASGMICRCIKGTTGAFDTKIVPFSQWGYSNGLYGDRLETYFGLIEGDAVRPIEMLLRIEPLNRPQRESLIGFIVIQHLRNPHFMASLKERMRPIVEQTVGQEAATDDAYMQRIYESLYRNNELYDHIARPILENRWVVARAKNPQFVLPDTCNIWGSLEGQHYMVMPLTPTDCLIVLPMRETTIRVIPFYVNPPDEVISDITAVLMRGAVKEFLASLQFERKRRCRTWETSGSIERITKVLTEITCAA